MNSAVQLSGLSREIAGVVERVGGRVVAVNGGNRRGASGIHWRPGVIVTAESALERDEDLSVTLPGGREVAASLAGRDPSTDVAVLRFTAEGLPSAEVGDASDLRAGHFALAVGNYGSGATASLGIVGFAGGAWESMRGGLIDGLIRLDLNLSASAEGGAVADAEGRVVGMAVFGPHRRVLVIPARTIDRVIDPLLAKGRIPRGYLGAGLQRVELPAPAGAKDAKGRRGLLVVSIDPNAPASAAGLRVGDIVLTWNGTALRRVRELMRQLGPESVGRKIELGLIRGDAPLTLSVVLGERPAG
ncbi:MAG TPA: S1C family serine protease [Stellaceae bacterium]|nr:S1C family serine protease [Stellaceae bacterium]